MCFFKLILSHILQPSFPENTKQIFRSIDKNQMIIVTPSDRFEIKYKEEPDIGYNIPPPIVQRKYHKCNNCKAQFERSYQLKRHNFVAHNAVVKQSQPLATSTPIKYVLSTSNPPASKIQPTKQTVVVQAKPQPQPQTFIKIMSPATINSNKQAATPITLYKSFTNGATPFPAVNPTPLPAQAPAPQYTLSFAPNKPKTVVLLDTAMKKDPPNNIDKRVVTYPRIIVRKELAGQPAKFDETTKNEWSQIVYQVSSNGGPAVIFKCAVCERSYENLVAIDSHLQCHNGQAFRYKCELCDEFVASVAHLRNHVHSHTCSQKMPLKCARCEHRFPDQTELEAHDCKSEPNAICGLCRQTFLTDSLLQSHCFLHSRVKPYKCESCDTRFIHLASLTKHKEVENSCSMLTHNCIIGN